MKKMNVEPPKHVTGAARKVWRQLGPVVGTRLNDLTARSFEQLCAAVVAFAKIDAAIRDAPIEELVIEHSNGAMGMNPLEKIRTQRSSELRGLLKDWGLTPCAIDLVTRGEMTCEEFAQNLAFEEL